jgi:RND family efflux transporter MFP subunit
MTNVVASKAARPDPKTETDQASVSGTRKHGNDATVFSAAGQARHGAGRGHGPKRDIIELSHPRPGDGSADTKPRTGARQGDGNQEHPPAPPPKSVLVVAVLVVLGLLAWGGYEHWRSYSASAETTSETVDHVVDVQTTQAKRLDTFLTLDLPGQTEAFDTATIFPRATGYISKRRVDIGTRVKKDDLLVHIAAPDLDQQLAQAEAQMGQTRAALVQAQAQVAQAEANLNLAKVTFARTNRLTQQGYETQQNDDTQHANTQTQQANLDAANAGVKVADANVQAQQATIDRLKALTAFEDVVAPFDGVITARNVDIGDLVNADSTTASPMFAMVRDDIIRVIVRVPQSAAIGMRNGLPATVKVPQMPDHEFRGLVARSSVALLYSSRSLTTEVDVPNPKGDLRPGLYVSASFQVPRAQPEVNVPSEALIFNQHGMQVASVQDGKVSLHDVEIDRDHGTNVDLRNGLSGGERIVLNPPALLKDGTKVNEARQEDQKQPGHQQQSKN